MSTINYPYCSIVYYIQILEEKKIHKVKVQMIVLPTMFDLWKKNGSHIISLLLESKTVMIYFIPRI